MKDFLSFLQTQIGQSIFEHSPSPVAQWIGGKLIAIEEGKTTIELTVRKDMTNPLGTLHGGMTACILDEFIGMTVYLLDKEHHYTTGSLNVNYLRPARVGDTIFAEVEVVRNGKTIVFVSANLLNDKKELIAHATSNMVNTNLPKMG